MSNNPYEPPKELNGARPPGRRRDAWAVATAKVLGYLAFAALGAMLWHGVYTEVLPNYIGHRWTGSAFLDVGGTIASAAVFAGIYQLMTIAGRRAAARRQGQATH